MFDYSSIVSQFIMIIFFISLFVILLGLLKSASFKGRVGEIFVNVNNRIRLNASVYQQLSDVTLRLEDKSSTQIDHIVLSRFGIFVIETKNMKGWIFGSEYQKRWTQSIYGKKNSFQNPLLQNHRHIKALEEFLGIERGLYSIVTFVGESSFKTAMPGNVFKGGAYISYIQSFREELFSEEEIERIVQRLASGRLKRSGQTNKEHVSFLKRGFVQTKVPLYESDPKIICRRCRSVMVERRNRKTQEVFLGCSAYPRCKNTEVFL